jgi:hypothetical protein
MIQVSLVGYLVGGAFLYLAYFDLPYYLMILATILKAWMRQRLLEPNERAAHAIAPRGMSHELPVAR